MTTHAPGCLPDCPVCHDAAFDDRFYCVTHECPSDQCPDDAEDCQAGGPQ